MIEAIQRRSNKEKKLQRNLGLKNSSLKKQKNKKKPVALQMNENASNGKIECTEITEKKVKSDQDRQITG